MIAARSLSVAQTLDLYLADVDGHLAPKTVAKMGYEVRRWESHVGAGPIDEITKDVFSLFRSSCQEKSLSNDSIESAVGTVMTLLRWAHSEGRLSTVPSCGRRLPRKRGGKFTPTPAQVGAMYSYADIATWPTRIDCKIGDFWRAWICATYFTGMRLEDQMLSFYWSSLADDHIHVMASKTEHRGVSHYWPMHPVVKRHLDAIAAERPGTATAPESSASSAGRACDTADARVFPVPEHSESYIRRELEKMCLAAGVPKIGPQALRRACVTEWTAADETAGKLVHGEGLGVRQHYVDVLRILRRHVGSFRWPAEMLTKAELDAQRVVEEQMLHRFRRLPLTEQQAVLALAEKLGT